MNASAEEIERAAASMERLSEIFETAPAIRDSDKTDAGIISLDGRIEFDSVAFKYADNLPAVLQDLSFVVPAGSSLAIVGRTGSGKTTLTELLPRLLEATSGVIALDGHPIDTIPVEVLRASIGYVPQDVFLFSDSISNNIAFGRMNASAEEIERAAEEADLLDSINDFQEGFDTFVGERGITLSGGQKQRTSIARALIRRPNILILDDALSAVDMGTEQTILKNLRSQFGERTIVIVSHRISAVQDADQIIVLDEGHIAEFGSHATLVRAGGLYADLHHKQQLEEELDLIE